MAAPKPIPENITQELYKRNLELAVKNKTRSLPGKLCEASVLERFDGFSGDGDRVREVLRDGAHAARSVAAQTLRRVQENIGLVMLS